MSIDKFKLFGSDSGEKKNYVGSQVCVCGEINVNEEGTKVIWNDTKRSLFDVSTFYVVTYTKVVVIPEESGFLGKVKGFRGIE